MQVEGILALFANIILQASVAVLDITGDSLAVGGTGGRVDGENVIVFTGPAEVEIRAGPTVGNITVVWIHGGAGEHGQE